MFQGRRSISLDFHVTAVITFTEGRETESKTGREILQPTKGVDFRMTMRLL